SDVADDDVSCPPHVEGADETGSEGVGGAQGEGLHPVIERRVLRIQQIAAEAGWLGEVREVIAAENGLLGGRSPVNPGDVLILILRQRKAVHEFATRGGRQRDVLEERERRR